MLPKEPVDVHKIKPVGGFKPPRYVIFIDTEAVRLRDGDTERQTFLMGVAIFDVLASDITPEKRSIEQFTDPAALWGWVAAKANKYDNVYVFTHNLDYDFQLTGGFKYLNAIGYKLVAFAQNGVSGCIVFRKGRNKIRVIDSAGLLRGSIAQLGKLVGLEKLEFPGQVDPGNPEHWAYCRRDVEILERAVLDYFRFLSVHDLGEFRATVAGQAFAAYRHRFMSTPLVAARDSHWVEAERAAYYGGRCECWKLGTFNSIAYYKLDVNSMYPYVMREFEHPTRPLYYVDNPPLKWAAAQAGRYWLLGRVFLDTPEPIYPYRQGDKLYFPVGRFWTWLCGAELAEGLARGHIQSIDRLYVYEKGRPFVDYVDYFYAMRVRYKADGNGIYDFLCKLFLNSLYGKFGERGRNFVEIQDGLSEQYYSAPIPSADGSIKAILYHIGTSMYLSEMEGEAVNSFPALAASVTAAARLTLYKLAEIAGRPNVYYMDTDSLIVTADGLHRLNGCLSSVELGKLKVEGESTILEIRNCKDYTFGSDTKVKGLSKNCEVDTAGQVWRWVWRRLRGALRQGAVEGVILDRRPYTRRTPYEKGKVYPDGRVEPLELCEPCPPEPLAAF